MKKIALIFIVILITSCKKTTITPTPIEPVCVISTPKLDGKYRLDIYNNDTIQVVFLRNNCPVDNSNIYLVKGLGYAVQLGLRQGESFLIKDYEITVDETTGKGVNGTNFSLSKSTSGNLFFGCSKMKIASIGFVKI